MTRALHEAKTALLKSLPGLTARVPEGIKLYKIVFFMVLVILLSKIV